MLLSSPELLDRIVFEMKKQTYYVFAKYFSRGDEWTQKFKVDEATLIDFATRFQDKADALFDHEHPNNEEVENELDEYLQKNCENRVDDVLAEMLGTQFYRKLSLQQQLCSLKENGKLHVAGEETCFGIGKTKLLALEAAIGDENEDDGWD